ncbi:MAG TPA: fused MFS/spermidine synthase, partial [Chthoniobacteraceae bacterium]|nr:fused MFS/spermidine synthase [Chthoniobacteraceae bacterium]
VYQLAWLREFRLIFGTSTAASAAVLGVFMGGLGLGGILLGRRADRAPVPLALYGWLEVGIAAAAALSPVLVMLARALYLATGGSMAWGSVMGTGLRILLAAVVLAAPTFLMGGTFPAAAKAVSRESDDGRRAMAFLYGANALGAVVDVVTTTFFLFERLGTFLTLITACLANLFIGIVAILIAKRSTVPAAAKKASRCADASRPATSVPRRFVLVAAAFTGFAFLLLEIVWYRMLSPLLGGSTYSFGLILAGALLGVGIGGTAYAIFGGRKPASLWGFAMTCTIEAFFIALPFALGDRVAVLTALLQPFGLIGFAGQVLGWSVITFLVVVPASLAAGVQFPTLLSLLGRGGHEAGSDTGQAYAWNMAGAIAGSLAGGFGILPLLSATRTWQLAAGLLVALGLAAVVLSWRRERRRARLWLPTGFAIGSAALLQATGPTAVWRHSPIGAGRINVAQMTSRNELRAWMNATRHTIVWSADGVESSIGISNQAGLSFLVNGKSDGNVRDDAGTQVMFGLIGALLHPNPAQSLVVGLGTGSSAGWLAAVPTMQRVDVVELEPSVLHFAQQCGAANHDAMNNPKLHVIIGDAREVTQTTRDRYDLIASEPSNPYRAGVAGLFTREFYTSAAEVLRDDGHFCQWLQAYEVDSETIRTIYATLVSVFPIVETWQTLTGDLCFVASKQPVTYDVAALRERMAQEPFRSALARAMRVSSLEGLLGHYVANEIIADALARSPGVQINTDDRNILEYAFARTVGRSKNFETHHVLKAARDSGAERPLTIGEGIDWNLVELGRASMYTNEALAPPVPANVPEEWKERIMMQVVFSQRNHAKVVELWFAHEREPADWIERSIVALSLAHTGDERAVAFAEPLKAGFPGEAAAVLGILRWQQDRLEEATQALEAAFAAWRQDPWALSGLPAQLVELAVTIGREDADKARPLAARLHRAVCDPFAVNVANESRCVARAALAAAMAEPERQGAVLQAVESWEPHVVWKRGFLEARAEAYRVANDSRSALATCDLEKFLANDALPSARATAANDSHRSGVPMVPTEPAPGKPTAGRPLEPVSRVVQQNPPAPNDKGKP